MKMITWIRFFFFIRGVLPFACLLAGCNGNHRLPTYETGGVVAFTDGTALTGGFIFFQSIEHGKVARAVINADGTFRLGTFEPDDGALAGTHHVRIIPAKIEGFDPDDGRLPAIIHTRYLNADTSGLIFEVLPDGQNDFRVVLERPPGLGDQGRR
jgi:hypothetical protein